MVKSSRADASSVDLPFMNPNWRLDINFDPLIHSFFTSWPSNDFLKGSINEIGLKSVIEGEGFLGRRMICFLVHLFNINLLFQTSMRTWAISIFTFSGAAEMEFIVTPLIPPAVFFFFLAQLTMKSSHPKEGGRDGGRTMGGTKEEYQTKSTWVVLLKVDFNWVAKRGRVFSSPTIWTSSL